MRNRVFNGLLITLLVFAIGAPWAVLQYVAWTGMLLQFSARANLSNAVKMTFDGRHPCKLCHLVKQGKESESKQEREKPSLKLKLDLALLPRASAMDHPPVPPASVVQNFSIGRLPAHPPHPPPRPC
jgi:hypothetical protein